MIRSPLTDAVRAGAYKIVEEDLRAMNATGLWLDHDKGNVFIDYLLPPDGEGGVLTATAVGKTLLGAVDSLGKESA